MFPAYLFCFISGAILIFLAIFSGDNADIDSMVETSGSQLTDHLLSDIPYGFLVSTRFWSFGICFFGLSGLLLILFVPTLNGITLNLIALATAVFIGFLSNRLMNVFSRRNVNSLVLQDDLLGLTGIVKLPIDSRQRGTVELLVKGSLIRRTALSLSGPLKSGEEIVVMSLSGNNLKVMHADQLTNQDTFEP